MKMHRLAPRPAILCLALLVARLAIADMSKISPDLQPLLANPSQQVNLIVQYSSSSSSSGGLLGGLLGGILKIVGGLVNAVFSLIPAEQATMPAGNILALSDQSNVAYISLDRPVQAMLDYSAAAVSGMEFRARRQRNRNRDSG